MNLSAISFDNIVAAHIRLAAVAHRTPVMTSVTANHMTGAELPPRIKESYDPLQTGFDGTPMEAILEATDVLNFTSPTTSPNISSTKQ